jgi:hypothetical protein
MAAAIGSPNNVGRELGANISSITRSRADDPLSLFVAAAVAEEEAEEVGWINLATIALACLLKHKLA